ncbi:MAG: hypothetical protein P9L92_03235 [Candidatus Electryonea clarkiae]|nr:hypothetical protein [Candidatus Electryonea clarkiae]MDP8286128.1 hypothetical protein [Candidatus Electryonea clarkiae]
MREPSTLEHNEADFYLSQDIDTLMIMLGRSLTKESGAELAPETAKRKAQTWLGSFENEFRRRICDDWGYCEKRKNNRLDKTSILAVSIGDIILSAVGQLPVLNVASILIKMGLEELCGCRKD